MLYDHHTTRFRSARVHTETGAGSGAAGLLGRWAPGCGSEGGVGAGVVPTTRQCPGTLPISHPRAGSHTGPVLCECGFV